MSEDKGKKGRRPTHDVLGYHEGSDGKLHYSKCGSGWETENGDIKAKAHSFPTNGNLIIRRNEDRLEEKRNGGAREERRERRSSRDRYD